MKIYTGQGGGEKLEKVINLNMGVMISSNPNCYPSKDISRTYCALDNGAFACYNKGYPFQEDIFIKAISDAYRKNINLDFIVCPDIVKGGIKSLEFSLFWAKNKLIGTKNLALVVQDGMEPKDLEEYGISDYFTYIFVGGSVEWKWANASKYVEYAKNKNMKVHIGQCGKLEYLIKAYKLNVDSVDSTSWYVNDSFHIVESFKEQIGELNMNLFSTK